MPTQIEITPLSTWRKRFQVFEMRFFNIAAAEWRTALQKKLTDQGTTYNAFTHEAHVQFLNELFDLSPRLLKTTFDGSTTLIAVREDFVAPRLPAGEKGEPITLTIHPQRTLAECGLEHLG